MSWEREVEDIKEKRKLALEQGGAAGVDRQHNAGRMTSRERIDALLDNDSFHEMGAGAGATERNPDGAIASYQWSQISGTSVALSSPNEATTTFTSPAEENILVFALSVTDELGGADSDTVSVLVQNTTTSVDENLIPKELKLFGNYPNPFNPNTEIMFQVLKQTEISLIIYNVAGQSVWTKNLGQ